MHMDDGVGMMSWLVLCGGVLVLVGLGVALAWLAHEHRDPRRRLAHRYAAGEIGSDEYYERLYALDPR